MAYKLKANLFQKAMIGAAPVMTAWEGYSYGRDKNGEFEGDSKKQLKELGKSAAFGGAIGAALNSDFFGNTSGSKLDIAAAKIKKRYDKKLMSGVQLPDSELKSLNNANKRLVGYGGWTGRKMKGRLKAAGSNAALTLGIGALGWAGGKLMNKRNQNKQNQIQAGEYDKEVRQFTKENPNKPFDARDLTVGAGVFTAGGLGGAMLYDRKKKAMQNKITSAETNRDLADLGIIGTMGGLGVASGAVQNHFTRKSNFEKNKKLAKEALDRAEKLEKGQVQPNTYDYTTKNGTKGTSVENAATHRKYAANLNNKHSKINLKTGMNKTKWGLAGAGLATAGVALSRYNQYRNNKKLQQSSNQYN